MGILFNETVFADNVDDAFYDWINKMQENKTNQKSRDGDVIAEIINATTVISDPTKCIMQNELRKMPIRYAIGEMLWYASGNNSLKSIQKYTKNWNRMSDNGETVNSNYGWCIFEKYGFDQLNFVMEKLMNDPETRQAVIHIKEPNNKNSKDVNCTVCLQFFIRDEKLYMTTYMRSNDIWLGFPYDVFQFTNLQIYLAMKLGLDLGSYTHITGSLHLYERDYKKVVK